MSASVTVNNTKKADRVLRHASPSLDFKTFRQHHWEFELYDSVTKVELFI